MFDLKVTVTMPDLSRRWLDVPCPRCSVATPVQFRDIELRRVIVCRGCKSNIRLVDQWDSFYRMRRKLEDMIRNMGR